MLRTGLNPGEDLAVPFASRQLLLQRLSRDPDEVQKSLIEGTGDFVLAEFAREGRPAFVENARQHGKTAEPHARAARGMLRQVRSRQSHGIASANGCNRSLHRRKA